MIDWIKKFGNWLVVAIMGVLGVLLGIERWRRKKTEEKLDETEDALTTEQIENEQMHVANENLSTVAQQIQEVNEVQNEVMKDEEVSYNDIIDAWNSDKL